jgi:hypothetical protein
MSRVKAGGPALTTFSVSVSPSTKAKLKAVAQKRYGGSVSALIETIATQAERLDALAALLEGTPEPSAGDYSAFLAESVLEFKAPRRRASKAA